jgi:hypothetical protein
MKEYRQSQSDTMNAGTQMCRLDAAEHGQRNVAGEASRPNGSTNGEHPINPFVLRSLGVK